MKKVSLENSRESFLIKLPQAWNFIKKGCFPVNFAKFLRAPFFTEDLRWLLLSVRSLSKIQLYIFLINVERISLIVLVFSLFILNK